MSLSFTPSRELSAMSDAAYQTYLEDSHRDDGCPHGADVPISVPGPVETASSGAEERSRKGSMLRLVKL